jgi:hypothetical protein
MSGLHKSNSGTAPLILRVCVGRGLLFRIAQFSLTRKAVNIFAVPKKVALDSVHLLPI